MATKETLADFKKSRFSCLAKDSGAMYNNLVSPLNTSLLTLRISALDKEEFKKWAMLSVLPNARI